MGNPRKPNKRKRSSGDGACYRYKITGRDEWRWRVEPVGGGAGGKAGFKTQAEALAWWELHRGKPVAPGTVGEWLTRWLELHRAEWAPKTRRGYAQTVSRWLVPRLGSVRLRDLTGYDVKSLLADMAAEPGGTPNERHKCGRCLRTALNAAVELGVLGANPMTAGGGRGPKVRIPAPKHAEKLVFSAKEIGDLLRAADEQGKGHILRLWLDTGLRPQELLALDWEDIDLQRGTVRVWRAMDPETHELKEPKTRGSRRTIKLAAATVRALGDYCGHNKPTGPFLHAPLSRGGRWWVSELHKSWWHPLLEAAGIDWRGRGPYCCRHTMGTHLLQSGVPIKTVSRRLGHSSANQTLSVYAHLMVGDDDTAAEVMNELLS